MGEVSDPVPLAVVAVYVIIIALLLLGGCGLW